MDGAARKSLTLSALVGAVLAGQAGYWLMTPATRPNASSTRTATMWIVLTLGLVVFVGVAWWMHRHPAQHVE